MDLTGMRQEVVDEADFLLQEGLGVSHATQHAVEARHGVHAGANFVVGGEKILARFLITELRFVSEDRGELALQTVR